MYKAWLYHLTLSDKHQTNLNHLTVSVPSSPSDKAWSYNHPTPSDTVRQASDKHEPSDTICTIFTMWQAIAVQAYYLSDTVRQGSGKLDLILSVPFSPSDKPWPYKHHTPSDTFRQVLYKLEPSVTIWTIFTIWEAIAVQAYYLSDTVRQALGKREPSHTICTIFTIWPAMTIQASYTIWHCQTGVRQTWNISHYLYHLHHLTSHNRTSVPFCPKVTVTSNTYVLWKFLSSYMFLNPKMHTKSKQSV